MTSTRVLKVLASLTLLMLCLVMLAGCAEEQLVMGGNVPLVSSDAANTSNSATAVLDKQADPTKTAHEAENEVEVEGVVQALTANSITINGQTFSFDPAVVVQNGITLRVGGQANLKARQVNGVLTVVRIVAQGGVEHTATPTLTNTVKPTTHKATETEAEHTPQPTSNKGKGNSNPSATPKPTEVKHTEGNDDGGKNGNHNTPTVLSTTIIEPTEVEHTPTPVGTATVTVKPTEVEHTPEGTDDGRKGGDHHTPTPTTLPTVTLTVKPTEVEHSPEPTDDNRGGNHTPTPTTMPTVTATVKPTENEHTPTPVGTATLTVKPTEVEHSPEPTNDGRGGNHNPTGTPTVKPTDDGRGGNHNPTGTPTAKPTDDKGGKH